ncbi:pectate lyase family protein [Flavobacterium agrisoli]|uniref:T9SS type A sorting domain-containing protein n=1 Tax=Flavobacterium agrisoli TaxID=2793066 RepID=A0A934PMX7_9FLAO|nr:T9SS type A sorting domain-containing protein [Flavobacterium agrisoli]MBK0369769.1 T9SS type A sorting domain-containing protein [Flavobacterium agrisoli]
MKRTLLILTLVFLSVKSMAQTVTFTGSGGWFETAFAKWEPVTGATSYNVYYTGGGQTNVKIDNQLIRSYGSYFRADVMGLAAGSYTLTVKPVISGAEAAGSTTGTLNVIAHDRSGFAFNGGRVPGAYQANGTPKENAVILYLTENNKNTVSLTVSGATTNPCVGLQTILDGYKKGKETKPLIIRMIGQVKTKGFSYLLGGDIVIENGITNTNTASSYITFEGVGEDATADGWGIRVKNAANIEIRNIGSINCSSSEGDNIGLQQNNAYVWVHNCDFFYGDAGGDADQAKGDGALDSKKSNYVTFSYNHFWDSGKCNLLGLSEGADPGYVTYHHNWYDHSDSRHPRVRYYSAHIYNNYYDGNSKYGAGSTLGSDLFMEANYFRNCKYPMLTSMQGSDVYNPSTGVNDYKNYPTFSEEDGGSIKAFNNYMVGQSRFVPYGDATYTVAGKIDATTDFDAYVVSSRSETVPASVLSRYGNNGYNNFDTNSAVMYQYTPDSPEVAKTKVEQYAGRLNGGDFKWTFNNAVDDVSYAVNAPLKAALTGYTTSLQAVQGETIVVPSAQTLVVTSGSLSQDVVTDEAIETTVLTWGGDATDATVTGLPANGITFVKNTTNKTITISGTPTASVSFSVSTTGSAGTSVAQTGTISLNAVNPTPVPSGDMVHNFTASGKTSGFYSITGSINSTNGSVTYDGLSLTSRLKMESSTSIDFTTTAVSTLVLVFDGDFVKRVKVDGVNYTASGGIVTVSNLAAGTHSITKGDTTNLFYIKTTYNTTTLGIDAVSKSSLAVYPNPVQDTLNINLQDAEIQQIQVYTLGGALVKSQKGNQSAIDMNGLSTGTYVVKVTSNQGVLTKLIIKK